ncbi:hypothetical protein KI387_044158 [Taxus chinensis]|uniref:Uncharacterized protein n=1 Tax=Taxus chinensis TaxID=29808 RepID=A0AA38C520_TAXCH|nr:hypothetical protein KI387_044158 [Taxus chinensis]
MDSLLTQVKCGTVTFNNNYKDGILDKALNKLENISAEAQAYFNKWSKDKDLVSIANAERDRAVLKYENLKSQAKVLQVHLETAKNSLSAAKNLKQNIVLVNKQNNTLKRIIKEHGLDPDILFKAKAAADPNLLSHGDATNQEERILKNLDSAAEDLISSGVISGVGERGTATMEEAVGEESRVELSKEKEGFEN